MKTLYASLFVVINIFTFLVFAQNELGAKNSVSNDTSRGVRLSVFRPSLTFKSSNQTTRIETSDSISSPIGLSVGYEYLPIKELGWSSSLSYIDGSLQGGQVSLYRLDGNIGLAFNELMNFRAGINLSTVGKLNTFKDTNRGLGMQAVLGLHLARNFSLNLGYSEMKSDSNIIVQTGYLGHTESIQLSFTGPEVGISGTF